MPSSNHQGTAAKAAKATLNDLESMLSEAPSSERVCTKLAQVLRVRRNEVALLRLEKGSLRFIFPPELRSAGVLPLSGSAVAARTASTRTPLLSNAFMRVKHVSLFEAVKLGAAEEDKSQEQIRSRKLCRFRSCIRVRCAEWFRYRARDWMRHSLAQTLAAMI